MDRIKRRTGAAAHLPRPYQRMDLNDKKAVTGGILIKEPPEQFSVRSATSGVTFQFNGAPPPVGSYIGVDDSLLLQVIYSFNTQIVNCNLRILGLDGLIHPLKFTLTTAAGHVQASQTFQLMEGWLLSCVLTNNAGSRINEQCYASASLVRPAGGNLNQYELLVSGYLINSIPLGYPASVPAKPWDGPGNTADGGPLGVGAPAAGADFTFTVPANTRVRLCSATATLTTSATAANRLVNLVVDDGVNNILLIPSNVTLAASLANAYVYGDSLPYLPATNGVSLSPLPSQLILGTGWRVRSVTTNIQVADQWSAIILQGQFWQELP